MAGLYEKHHFLAFYDTMWITLGVAFGLGIIYLLLVQFFPLQVVPFTILIGGITFFVLAILVIAVATHSVFLRILVALVLIVLGVLCLYTLINEERRKSVWICARIINITTDILKTNWLMLALIPLFVFFLFCLLILVGFEILAAWSAGTLTFHPEYPFHGISGFLPNFLTVLILIQFYWGLNILKHAINFIVSGYSVLWYRYYERDIDEVDLLTPIWLLIRFHWGSIVGGAFLEGFFYFFDLLYDFFIWEENEKHDKRERLSLIGRESLEEKNENHGI